MKRRIENITGFAIGATDGEIGRIKDFYFDDQSWTIRYLVVQTGSWLVDRKVLIAPKAIRMPDWEEKTLAVNLTKEQVKNSPDMDTEKPVYRQQEIELVKYYNWPHYWAGGVGAGSLWTGGIGTTGMMFHSTLPDDQEQANRNEGKMEDETINYNQHLRSTQKVKGYGIKANDGEIGDVEDFIIDDNTWEIAYIIIDTGNWFPGKKVIISPEWIQEIQWETSTVVVNASIDQVRNSPDYQPSPELSESYEANLKNYYGRFITHKQ
jgi:sporulation protein YlmC with PRC-barrel domain